MPITAKQPETTFELVPSGNHIARAYSMIEIGTEEKEYQGEIKKAYTVRITWELPNEKKVFNQEKGEQPFSISKDYTLSMHEKANLRQDLESWRGKAFTDDEAKAFDITKLLGVPCMLNVLHNTSKNGKTYSNIKGVTAVPRGFNCPVQVNPTFVLSYDSFDGAKFAGLSDYLRGRIEKTPEYKKLMHPLEPVDHEPDFSPDDEPGEPDGLPF